MDRSLLIFYGLFIVLIGFYVWKAKKQRILTNTLLQLAALGTSMVLASLSAESGTGREWMSVVVIYFALLAGGAALFLGIKFHRGKKTFKAALNIIKTQGAAGCDTLLHDGSGPRLDWQVVYLPEQNTLEIGANIYYQKWVLFKKYYLRTLSGRTVYFIPDQLLAEVDLSRNGLYALEMFVRHSKETAELVRHYADAIKRGVDQPWKLFDEEQQQKRLMAEL